MFILISCSKEEASILIFELSEGGRRIGNNELVLADLEDPGDVLATVSFLLYGCDEIVSLNLNIELAQEVLASDELEQFESLSTVTLSEADGKRSGLPSPTIGSIVENSDYCSFLECDDSPEFTLQSPTSSQPSLSLPGSGLTSTASSQLPLGLLELELVGVENVPPSRLRLNVGGRQSPFIVLSFGRKSFRTKTVHRNSNPVWKERLFLPIQERECHYHFTFSLYNYRALAGNVCTGKTRLRIGDLLQSPDQQFKLALHFELAPEDMNADAPCRLLLRCSFKPIDSIRRAFWQTICRQFEQEPRGRLNLVEFEAMMNCVGPHLCDATLDAIADVMGPYSEAGEFEYEVIGDALSPLRLLSRKEQADDGASIVITQCPICLRQLASDVTGDEITIHVYTCERREVNGRTEKEMTGGFLTEENASRKWVTRLFSAVSFGGYELGKNNGNIFVQDRLTGKLIEEKMPTYVRLGIRMIYQQSGRAADVQMVRRLLHTMTIKQGIKFSAPASTKDIESFIRFHGLDMSEVLGPIDSFQSFNEFFYRKLKPDARPAKSDDPHVTLCPADCRLICYSTVGEATRFWIKGANFSVSELLKDKQLGEFFEGGSLAICRLAPQDYHRFHSPFAGTVNSIYHIPGAYFTVNPMAIRKPLDVLTENARTVVLLDNPIFGKVAYVAVGAMMVGSINITCRQGSELNALDEVGYFAFGGSTIVLVFPPGANQFDEDLLANSLESLETLVRVGQTLIRHDFESS